MRAKYVVIGVVVGLVLSSAAIVLAGNLDPPTGPRGPASQMYTLEQIYDRLDTGAVSGKMMSFTEPDTRPGVTGHTLDDVMDLAMAVSDPDLPCYNNTSRYVSCGNGTVHDQVTNLIWLQDANCFGQLDYAAANDTVKGLEDGQCGLTDGSSPGDWRLPTKEEWEATVARAVAMGCTWPGLTDTLGTHCNSGWPQPFTHIQATSTYFSSSASELAATSAWFVYMIDGDLASASRLTTRYVWPVRGGP